jgi:hypothetical protein
VLGEEGGGYRADRVGSVRLYSFFVRLVYTRDDPEQRVAIRTSKATPSVTLSGGPRSHFGSARGTPHGGWSPVERFVGRHLPSHLLTDRGGWLFNRIA